MTPKKTPRLDITKLEMTKLRELKRIAGSLDSFDLGALYGSAGQLVAHPVARSLLPKVMTLLDDDNQILRKLVFRMAMRNAYGIYLPELFRSMKTLNPAEREQVLQGLEEEFIQGGAPISNNARRQWIAALESLGVEHQPTVFGLMASLGPPGARWAMKKIRDNIKVISLGTVPKVLAFPNGTRRKMIQLLCQMSAESKRELLPYIGGIVDHTTSRYLTAFLRTTSWKDRVHVASAVGRLGIVSTRGIVMDLIADPDWRVKQGLLEYLHIASSKFSSLLRILGYLVTDSHKRVRGLAERSLLMLGAKPCSDSDLDSQRTKIMKR
ncbi:MAG: HEAT repeat domain-containing protein, partial [Candidatus Thorarchaeota archaeon]|nr:HEAT repeat domain-containing protein [Candidatus Thorarchaeota archaeon]